MFTGIVSSLGAITAAEPVEQGLRLRVEHRFDSETIQVGESIACNGACLTVTGKEEAMFTADLSGETVSRTAPRWKKGAKLNLERALQVGDRLGGHMVTGHVDGIAKIIERKPAGESVEFCLEAPKELAKFIAEKGSVTLDGVSLTVNRVNANRFWVMIIPHTLRATTLGEWAPGGAVNLEIDVMARYAQRLMQS